MTRFATRPHAWMTQALCLGHERLWDSEEWQDVQLAKAHCAQCPVRVPCAELCWSDSSTIFFGGTWAGKTANERRAIAKRTGIPFGYTKIRGRVDWAIMLTLDGAGVPA